MNVMNVSGSLTAPGGGPALPRRPPRRRGERAPGSSASSFASAIAFSTFALSAWSFFFLSFTASRLRGPRTGVRSEKIHPTPGTGLPPISRPRSKSQS